MLGSKYTSQVGVMYVFKESESKLAFLLLELSECIPDGRNVIILGYDNYSISVYCKYTVIESSFL